MYYVMNDKKEVKKTDLHTWSLAFKKMDRQIDRTTLRGADISTVFLGLDHGYQEGKPLIFETMVFGGKLDQEQMRCSTYQEALDMHKAMCERVLDET